MVSLQIISKVLESQDISIIENNLLTKEYFMEYEDEYQFIIDHYDKYGNVPDKATFLAAFNDVELVEVNESDEYLVDTIREENLYYRTIPVIQKAAELLKTNANDSAEYLYHALEQLQPDYRFGVYDILTNAAELDRDKIKNNFFTTGFPELDDIIGGFQRGDEFVVLLGRINEGKSWILQKICTHIWEIGFNVGYISPEMTPKSIGLRFDTLHGHFSNRALYRGDLDDETIAKYEQYREDIKETHSNHFYISTPRDFQKKITVSKLRQYVKQNKLDVLAIDGITYLTDERARKGDPLRISLSNISEDLKELSIELGIPIIIVCQANRLGASHDESDNTPEMEHIKESDGIGAAATQVIAIRQQKTTDSIILEPKKGRSNAIGKKVIYRWNIDMGDFEHIGTDNGSRRQEEEKSHNKEERRSRKPKKNVEAF